MKNNIRIVGAISSIAGLIYYFKTMKNGDYLNGVLAGALISLGTGIAICDYVNNEA